MYMVFVSQVIGLNCVLTPSSSTMLLFLANVQTEDSAVRHPQFNCIF